ncbi:hypothetical protein BH23ACT10_BH23ACT10_23340 [soil metagenome]
MVNTPCDTLRCMQRGRRPAWSTIAAAGLMAVLTAVFATYAILALRGLSADDRTSRDALLLGLSGREESNATVIIAIVMLVVCLLTLTQCVGIVRRRQGARHAALMTFGVLGFVSLAAALPGLFAQPPSPNARYGVLAGFADIAVVVLLLLPLTADDVELAERERA